MPGHPVSISMPSLHQFWSWSLLWRVHLQLAGCMEAIYQQFGDSVPHFGRWAWSLDSNASTLPSFSVAMTWSVLDHPTPSLYHLRVAFSLFARYSRSNRSAPCPMMSEDESWHSCEIPELTYSVCLCSEDRAIVELPVDKLCVLPIINLNIHIWCGVQLHSKPVVDIFRIGWCWPYVRNTAAN